MKKETMMYVFPLAQSFFSPEWSTLMGNKYQNALPFNWALTDDMEMADVIAWDGLVTPKCSPSMIRAQTILKEGQKVLLLEAEALTLFKDSPYVSFIDLTGVKCVELSGGNLLPEDLLAAIERCHEKLNHV